jgi:hypothetical protein
MYAERMIENKVVQPTTIAWCVHSPTALPWVCHHGLPAFLLTTQTATHADAHRELPVALLPGYGGGPAAGSTSCCSLASSTTTWPS